MRVVNRQQFLALPAGTMYAKGVPWAFDRLMIKGNSIDNDWQTLDLCWPDAHDTGEATAILEVSLETGASFAAETTYGRDGCFEKEAVFLIFEARDLEVFGKLVARAKAVAATEIGK